MKDKLKPCPFCGSEAELEQTGRYKITIKCKGCRVEYNQKTKANSLSLEWLEEYMINTWNKRVKD